MHIVITKNKVKKEGLKDYVQVSNQFIAELKRESGVIHAFVQISDLESDMVINVEVWENKQVYDVYDHHVFLKYKERLKKNFISNETEVYSEM